MLIKGVGVIGEQLWNMAEQKIKADDEIHNPRREYRIYPLLSDNEVHNLDPYKKIEEKRIDNNLFEKKMQPNEHCLK